MSRIALLLILIASYGLGYWGSGVVMRKSGDHRYHRAQVALTRLHWMIQDYSKEYGRLPETQALNSQLKARWSLGRDFVPKEIENDEEKWHLNFIVEGACEYALHLWSSPPHFILTAASPDGFGFFLDGEDGFSATQGKDRDDINSWNPSSIDFYYERMGYRRLLRDHAVGAVFAAGAFMIYIARKRKRRNPTSRGWEPAISTSIS